MIIVLNSKKTLVITSIGLCFIGSFFAALKFFYRSKRKKAIQHKSSNSAKSSKTAGKLSNKSHETSRQSNAKSTNGPKIRTERSVLLESIANQDNINNLPAEELLELGMNYLNQAIKSWETAVDSIESAAYMQSKTLALPTDEHADLVFKLRSLLDKANEINLHNTVKLIKSSRALQIIQSRLAYKQQLYAEALLKSNSISSLNLPESTSNYELCPESTLSRPPSGESSNSNHGVLSEDDNESFISADSEFDWIDEDMFQRIENVNDRNALYEMAYSSANLGRIAYRISRCELFNCRSETDFAAKLHVIRLGFDRYLQDSIQRDWLINQGQALLTKMWNKAGKDPNSVYKAYEELVKYCTTEGNHKLIKDELATRDVTVVNFYDVCLDFILIDAFEDLEQPPSAIVAVIQNRWLSQSFKETALETAVWSILKAKRKILKYPNGLISRFYSLNEYLVPVLAWGFLGTDKELNKVCTFMKNHIVEYLRCLFDANRTRYTNLDEIAADFEIHTKKYLQEILDHLSED